jgi:hypothetical protein
MNRLLSGIAVTTMAMKSFFAALVAFRLAPASRTA